MYVLLNIMGVVNTSTAKCSMIANRWWTKEFS